MDIEANLTLATRVLHLRAAAADPKAAMKYVKDLLKEAEGAYAAGLTTTRAADAKATALPPPASRSTPKRTTKAPKGPAHTGITDEVEALFADGRPHFSKDLQKRTGIPARKMKKALRRLVDKGSIKRVGKAGSGQYVRKGTAARK